MDLKKLENIITNNKSKSFKALNFGCRVNSAEINQLSQLLTNFGLQASTANSTDIFLVNTCSITKKGEYESLSTIKKLSSANPNAIVLATGCANLKKLDHINNVITFDNNQKESLLENLSCAYTPSIKDKFSHTHRFLLKVQSGCTAYCTYCTVPYQRPYLWSLPIDSAVKTVNQAIADGYQEIIITGVNLEQYRYGFSQLIKNILEKTSIPLISFGSIPINVIDQDFIRILRDPQYSSRFATNLHIPIQSGSDKILKLMNRSYNVTRIKEVFSQLKSANPNLTFGTDIIVGFPTESEVNFQDTYELCQSIGFTHIHTFRYSPRPGTAARLIHQKSSKITKEELANRSRLIRQLNGQTTLPSHQTLES